MYVCCGTHPQDQRDFVMFYFTAQVQPLCSFITIHEHLTQEVLVRTRTPSAHAHTFPFAQERASQRLS